MDKFLIYENKFKTRKVDGEEILEKGENRSNMVAFYRIGRIMKAKASRLFGKENLNDESNRYCKTGSVGSVCIDAADLLHFAGRQGESF